MSANPKERRSEPGEPRGAMDAPFPTVAEGLRGFVRRHGVARTTAYVTVALTAISVGATYAVVYFFAGRPVSTPGLVVSVLVPSVISPVTLGWLLRALFILDLAEERRRDELSEQVKIEESLRESEARYRALFEHTDAMILVVDFEGTIVMANPRARLELERGVTLVGASFFDLGKREELERRLGEIVEVGEADFETALRGSGSGLLVTAAHGVVVDRDAGLVQVVLRDISAHKNLERTLRRAKEESEAASRLKTRFVFNVSHDLRTPLNGIIGFAEAILAERSVELAHQHAWTILQESETLLSLLNDLLDLARIESGRIELDPGPVDLERLAESALSPFAKLARAQDVSLSWAIAPEVPRVIRADELRLRQALLNLLSNAVKFTTEGKVELTIALTEDDEARERLFFSVADTGIGIDPALQERIFHSFVQAEPSTDGTGIGLGTTIARELVTLMGGEIGVFSVPGEGSTFWFTLPLEEAEGEVPPPRATPLATAVTSHSAQRRGHVLVVEDYPTNQTIARLQLESAGHRVTLVENGAEALAACRDGTGCFDVILMDLQMPVMGGLEASREIRALGERWREVPIVAMTASAEASTREACTAAGMNDVVIKPLHRDELLGRVARWVGAREATGAPPAPRSTPHPAALLDLGKALEQLGGNRPLLESTLDRFVDQTRADLEAMARHLESDDREKLRREAHKLKGAAAYLAATPLAEAAAALERSALEAGDTRGDLERLNEAFARFSEHVGELMRRGA